MGSLVRTKKGNTWASVSLMRSFQVSVHQWEKSATVFIQFEPRILELLSVATAFEIHHAALAIQNMYFLY